MTAERSFASLRMTLVCFLPVFPALPDYFGIGNVASFPPPMSGISRLFPSGLTAMSAAD